MTVADVCWAYQKQDLPPLDKFVLVAWADDSFSLDSDIGSLARRTSMTVDDVSASAQRLAAGNHLPADWEGYRPPVTPGTVNRRRVYPILAKRDGEQCRGCAATSNLQIDHVMPRALGGTNELTNLQLLCAPCNRRKSDLHPDTWRRLLEREEIGELVPG